MRKAAIIAASVVAVLVLLIVLLPSLVPLDAYKPRIVAAMEEKTGRKVDFRGLRLRLFPAIGVKVSGLTVSGDPGHEAETFVSVPAGEIRLAILPLLAGRAEFRKILLDRPAILFRSYKDGTTSLTDILRNAKEPPAPEGKAPPPAKGGVTVRLREVSVEDARLSLRSEGEDGRETRWEIFPFTLRVSGVGEARNDFDVQARIEGAVRGDVRLSGTLARDARDPAKAALTAEASLFRQDADIEGRVDTGATPVDLDVTASFPKIRLDDIPEIFAQPPAALVAARPGGTASLAAKLSGSPSMMGFEVDADLTGASFTVRPGLQKFIDTPCTVVAQGRRFPDQFVLSNAELRFPPLMVIANASYSPGNGAMEWRGSARIDSLAELARNRGEYLQQWAPTGKVTASGTGKRPAAGSGMEWDLRMDLAEVGARLPGRMELRALNGHVGATPEAAEFSPLVGLLNGQRFHLRGKVALGETVVGPLDLQMSYLDLDALLPSGGQGKKAEGKDAQAPAPSRGGAAGGKKAGYAFLANLKIDAGRAKGIDFRDLRGRVRFERGAYSFEELRTGIYGGEVAVDGRFDQSGPNPSFRLKADLKKVPAEQILSRKTTLKDFVTGPVDLTADIGGQMKSFADFARTASGSGTFRVTGGKIKGIDLYSTATQLAGLQNVVPPPPSGSGGAIMKETPFSDLSADFRISGGKIRTDALRILSDRLGVSGSAAVGFDRTLDFVGALTLPQSLSSRIPGGAGKYIAGPGGRAEIPLVMSGSLTAPRVSLDTQALARGTANRALQRLMEKVPGAAPPGGKEGTQRQPGGEGTRKALEGLFDKLLPKK